MLQGIITPVSIISGLGLLFGLGLAYVSKKFEVKEDERITAARELLPGANCGACGYSGCDGFAEAVVTGNAELTGCSVGGSALAIGLGKLLGKDISEADMANKVARILCGGDKEKSKLKYEYYGISNCSAAASLHGGPSACNYGCLGMGDCARVCPFDAIVVKNGLACVIASLCTGCGKCIEACPKGIIKLVPPEKQYTVRCNNPQRGKFVIGVCKVGCIGCRKCSKVCESGAITNDGFVARINPQLCINCGKCIEVCPNHVINKYPVYKKDIPAAANE